MLNSPLSPVIWINVKTENNFKGYFKGTRKISIIQVKVKILSCRFMLVVCVPDVKLSFYLSLSTTSKGVSDTVEWAVLIIPWDHEALGWSAVRSDLLENLSWKTCLLNLGINRPLLVSCVAVRTTSTIMSKTGQTLSVLQLYIKAVLFFKQLK